MRRFILSCAAILGLIVVWYVIWHSMVASDVARVRASIEYQNQQFKTANRNVVLKDDAIYASGFPFHFRVRVDRLTLSMIQGNETFAVSLPRTDLVPVDAEQGRYRVLAPTSFDALYAADGHAPENYRVTMSEVPPLLLRAQGDSQHCSGFPGAARCADVAADAPLITYAVALPPSITLHMELNGESRDAKFTMPAITVPIFQTIPTGIDYPLSIFIGVLREALVFRTGDHPAH